MCGRFTLTLKDYSTLVKQLGAMVRPEDAELYRPRYNVAPTDWHWILQRADAKRVLMPARWGLINQWSPDASLAARQINARAETVDSRPAYRRAFESRRCLVPVDGFYEWKGPRKARQPVWFHYPNNEVFLLAGLYEDWRADDERIWRTFTILTTEAQGVPADVHDRMPVIVPPEDIEGWIGKDGSVDLTGTEGVKPLLAKDVSVRANSIRNDDPSCLGDFEASGSADDSGQKTLF